MITQTSNLVKEEEEQDEIMSAAASALNGATPTDSIAPSEAPSINTAMKRVKSFNVHVQAPLPRGFVEKFRTNFFFLL